MSFLKFFIHVNLSENKWHIENVFNMFSVAELI